MASARTDAARVAEARRWFRLLGHVPRRVPGGIVVITPEHPETWDVNFLISDNDALPEDVLAALDGHFPSGGPRVLHVDSLTPPAVEAAVALAGYVQEVHTLEMVARDVLGAVLPLPRIALSEVSRTHDLQQLEALVQADHLEGARTGQIDDAVAAGLMANMRRHSTIARYRLIIFEGMTVGYGLAVACPNGLGLIENLFVLPQWRKRGVMSAFLHAADRLLRDAGCNAVFLDAHVHDRPKHLYARLGFAPVALNRTWVQQALP